MIKPLVIIAIIIKEVVFPTPSEPIAPQPVCALYVNDVCDMWIVPKGN